jgi:hypothetical protein
MDGFDHMTNTQVTRKWSGSGSTNAGSMQTGRFGSGQAIRLTNASFILISPSFANSATVAVGCALRLSSFAGTLLLALRDAGTTQVELRVDSTGHLYLARNNTPVGSASTNALSTGVWYFVEFRATIDNATGAFEIRVGEVVWASGSGLDTQNTANAYVNELRVSPGATLNMDVDDLYVADDFLGDCRIETIYPSGAGTTTEWTPSAGANYAAVDETTADDDTTYVATAGVGDQDTYVYGDLVTATGVVKAVQINPIYRIDTSGARTLVPVTRSGGSEADGAAITVNSTTYRNARELQEQNPVTAATWTIAEVNAAEFGIRVTA